MFTLLIFKLLHKITMQSITYMLSFITFASLLPRLSDFSLQERSEQTALITPEAKWREKSDNEFFY